VRPQRTPGAGRPHARGAERERDEPVAPRERLELVAVDDGEVGVHGDWPRWSGVQAEEPRRLLPGRDHGAVRDLELAEHCIRRRELEPRQEPVCAGRHDDLVLAARIDEDDRDARRC